MSNKFGFVHCELSILFWYFSNTTVTLIWADVSLLNSLLNGSTYGLGLFECSRPLHMSDYFSKPSFVQISLTQMCFSKSVPGGILALTCLSDGTYDAPVLAPETILNNVIDLLKKYPPLSLSFSLFCAEIMLFICEYGFLRI